MFDQFYFILCFIFTTDDIGEDQNQSNIDDQQHTTILVDNSDADHDDYCVEKEENFISHECNSLILVCYFHEIQHI